MAADRKKVHVKNHNWNPLGLLITASATAFLITGCGGPEAEAKRHERDKIALCEKDLNDPLTPASTKVTIIKPVCERFKEEFRSKYKAEP